MLTKSTFFPSKNIVKTIFVFSLFLPQLVFSQTTKLKVVPEVQVFTFTNSTYTMPSDVQIAVNTSKNDSLMAIATQLKTELLTMFRINATISTTSEVSASGVNQILLAYSATPLRNYETYNMELNPTTGVTISGSSSRGAYWATRTLLQLMENHKNIIPTGKIYDYPNFPNRGFMIDAGRKFFTIGFLRDYVKMMSYYKMNELHVHLSDNGFKQQYNNDWAQTYAAFRLESETFPGLAAKDGYYTKAQFRDLQLLGMQYGVNVVPEIDIPAHSLAFTRYKPEIQAAAPYAADHLAILDDTKLPVIYDFFDKLFDEYISGANPTFVAPDVHIGTDEFIKEGDARNVDNAQSKRFREFTNHYLKFIADRGKTPRLWGGLKWLQDSPLTPVPPVGNAIMNAWSYDWVDPNQMLNDGFKIITTCDTWLYIVPAAGYYRDFLDENWIYTNFRPEKVNANQTLTNFQKGLLGSTFAVWNDNCSNGISQKDVHYRVLPAMKVMAAKNWKVSPAFTYTAYKAIADSLSEGPGLNLIGKYLKDSLTSMMTKIGSNPVVFNGTTKINLGGTDFGYNYDISFDLYPEIGNAKDAVLFQSDYSKVTLNTNGTGKIGFSRDGYVYTFNYIPKNAWQNIRLTGDYKSVTLYADGVKIERLTAYSKNGYSFQQTLYFPLQYAGDAVNGLKGQMKNLKLAILDLDKIKADFLATKTQLVSGLYYIVNANKYLTNTNINGSGGTPSFAVKNANQTNKAQQWNITIDTSTGRHKITSAADNRYVNELGDFGTNPYYATWNTYNFYKKDTLYAVQNDGDAGKGFWNVANNRFNRSDEIYDDSNYMVQFIPVNATSAGKLITNPIHFTLNDSSLKISGVTVKSVSLLTANGKAVYIDRNRNEIKLKPDWKGAFIVQLIDTEDRVGAFKVLF